MLRKAARDGNLAEVQRLLAGGAAIDELHGDKECTALWWAADRGREECVAALCVARADVNIADSTGTTPLIAAAYHGHLGCVETLLRARAQIACVDAAGDSALLAAWAQGHQEVAKLLEALMTSAQLAALPVAGDTMAQIGAVGASGDAATGRSSAAVDASELHDEARALLHEAEMARLDAEIAQVTLKEQERALSTRGRALSAREAALRDGQRRLQQASASLATPAYWRNRSAGDRDWHERVDVTAELAGGMQRLLNATCDAQYIGQGRDGNGMTHRGMRVLAVHRVEDAKLWRAFAARRKDVPPTAPGRAPGTVSTDDAADVAWLASLELDRRKGEVVLFQGAPSGQRGTADLTSIIERQGFDERVSNMGGMFGAGVYFAERCSKADAYAGPGAPGERAKLIVTRVVLGTPHVTRVPLNGVRRPPTLSGAFDGGPRPPTAERRCDSIVFDGTGKNYREFVVFDRSQCYPEFVVEYERV